MLTLIWYFLLLLSAFCFILTQNTIYATLWLIFIYILTAVLFINLNVSYLGLIFLMVYVGAIAILFLFIVMMLPLKTLEKENSIYMTFGLFFLCIFFFVFFFFTDKISYVFSLYSLLKENQTTSISIVSYNLYFFFQKIGYVLFAYYYMYVIIVGLILLVSMLGAIYLTNEQTGVFVKKQELQLTRVHLYRKGTF
jgi:NADH-quinone oxidoreductase subunit J